MQRIWQIRDVIWERRNDDERHSLRLREAELRTTTSFIAATVPDARAQSSLLKEAARIELFPRTSAERAGEKPLPKTGDVMRAFGIDQAGDLVGKG